MTGNLNRSFDEPSIHLRLNETFPKSNERSFAQWCLIGVQTVQHQLEASIHQRYLDHLSIRNTRVRLQNSRQSSLCWRNGRVSTEAQGIERCQSFLKCLIKDLMAVMQGERQTALLV